MQRKAQGLSLNTMVIAAIVLIIIVVTLSVSSPVRDFISDLKKGAVSECPGTPRDSSNGCRPGEKQVYKNFKEGAEGKVCCMASCEGLIGNCFRGNECKDANGNDVGIYKGKLDCPIGYICCG